MQLQSDTPSLDKLAADLGLERTSTEFRHVLEHLRAEAWTEADIANDYREALRAAKVRWNVIQRWAGGKPAGKRRARGVSSWRDYAAALERRAADIARQDGAVQAFRREVLNGSVVSPNHADVQAWLRKHRQHHDRLTGLARALADAHWWLPHDGLVFVLTDETPPRPPLRVQVQLQLGGAGAPRITVEAESWVPSDEVARAFRGQRDRVQKRARPEQPRRARALSPRAVALVAFVEGMPGSWRERVDAWNAVNPEAAFRDRANFRRTYEAARRRLDVRPTFLGA